MGGRDGTAELRQRLAEMMGAMKALRVAVLPSPRRVSTRTSPTAKLDLRAAVKPTVSVRQIDHRQQALLLAPNRGAAS